MTKINPPLDVELIARHNASRIAALRDDYGALSRALERRGVAIDAVKSRAADLELATPSWGTGTGGTRFARFPMPGEPTNIDEKLEDCAVIHELCRITPRVSPHFPWDKISDAKAVRERAELLGIGFDAVNSNTFEDQPDQAQSYRYGSLTHTSPAVREQAVRHNIECIQLGKALGSKALTVWIGDGTNFPGQQQLGDSLDRYLESARAIYAAIPADWRMFIEHKLYEPAFYSTVISDWGTSILIAKELGPKAKCLVDLGHHAPSVNIEQIVARLHAFGKLGGFHFNDSKYGDDDLDSGSINPHQLFLVFNELVIAEQDRRAEFDPAYMIDQSHNITDPVESLLSSAEAICAAFVKALMVDRHVLSDYQRANDVLMAFRTLRDAYSLDARPIVAMARYEAGGAIDPIAAFRESGWRAAKALIRNPTSRAAGIV
ncbi:MAG TPA: TIM barrel protein [Steroidobacteraceae bacterium]|nr:TIM barrel protein [Steroidobacteraceae bacterium]